MVNKIFILFSLFIFIYSFNLRADTVTYPSNPLFSNFGSFDPINGAPGTSLIQFPKFDSNMGTLTGVNVSLTGTANFSGVVNWLAPASTTATFFVFVFSLTDSANNSVSTNPSALQTVLNLSVFNGPGHYSIPQGLPLTSTSTVSNSFTNSISSLYAASGGGNVSLVLSLSNLARFITGNTSIAIPVSESDSAVASGMNITYTFTPSVAAPEPGTWLTLGSLLACGMLLRRRRLHASPT